MVRSFFLRLAQMAWNQASWQNATCFLAHHLEAGPRRLGLGGWASAAGFWAGSGLGLGWCLAAE